MSSNSNSDQKRNDEQELCGTQKMVSPSAHKRISANRVVRRYQLFKYVPTEMWSSRSKIIDDEDSKTGKAMNTWFETLRSQHSVSWKDNLLFTVFVHFYGIEQLVKDKSTVTQMSPKELIQRIYDDDTAYPGLWKTDILALKLYTDTTNDCSRLRQTFFSNPLATESDQSVMREKYLLWKTALEMAFSHYFSDHMADTDTKRIKKGQLRNKEVYHGSSNVCYDLFTDFLSPETITINGPFSTTTSISIAINFAENGDVGIIFELKPIYRNNNQFSRGPINTAGFAENGHENEKLFYNGEFNVEYVRSMSLNEKYSKRSIEKCIIDTNRFENSNDNDKTIMLSTRRKATGLRICFVRKYGSEKCWKLYDEDLGFMEIIDSAIQQHQHTESSNVGINNNGDNMIYHGYNDNKYDNEYDNEIIVLSIIDISLIGIISSCLCFIGFIIIYFILKKRIKSYLYPSNDEPSNDEPLHDKSFC